MKDKEIEDLKTNIWHEKEKASADMLLESSKRSSFDSKLEFNRGAISGMDALYKIFCIKIDRLKSSHKEKKK